MVVVLDEASGGFQTRGEDWVDEDIKRKFKPKTPPSSGGGGGSGGGDEGMSIDAAKAAQASAARAASSAAAEEQRKKEVAKNIEQQVKADQREARLRYQQDLNNIQGSAARLERVKQLNQEMQEARIRGSLQKVEQGLIDFYKAPVVGTKYLAYDGKKGYHYAETPYVVRKGDVSKAREEILGVEKPAEEVIVKNGVVENRQQAPPKVIGKWKSEYEKEYYKKSALDVAKGFIGIHYKNYRNIPEQLASQDSIIRNPFEAFKGYGRRVTEIMEDKPSPVIKTGSISPDESPYKTYGELQKEADIDRSTKINVITTKHRKDLEMYQEKVKNELNAGVITAEDADRKMTAKIEQVNKNLDKDLQSRIPKETRYYEKGVQEGDVVYEGSKLAPAFVAAAVSTAIPAVGVLYGTYLASESQKNAPIVISDTKNIPTYLYKKVPLGEKIESTIFIAAGGLGALGKLKNIERAIVQDEFERLAQKQTNFKADIYKGEKTDYIVIKETSTSEGLTSNVIIKGDIKKTGENSFIMRGAEGKEIIKGNLNWNIAGGGQDTKIYSYVKSKVGSKGTSFQSSDVGELRMIHSPMETKVINRLSPEQYLRKLVEEGKIRAEVFQKGTLGEGIIGRYYIPKNPKGTPMIRIQEELTGLHRQKVIAHELVHYKTPTGLFETEWKLKVPYKLRPSELIAYNLEKRLATKGFKVKPFEIVTSPEVSETLVEGTLQKTIGSTSVIPEYSTGIVYQTEKVKPYLVFPDPRVRTMAIDEIKREQKYVLNQLKSNLELGGTVSKGYGTSVSLKLPKNKYYVATESGDTGIVNIIYPEEGTGIKMFTGQGKKSSQEYLQSLYQEQVNIIPEMIKQVKLESFKATMKQFPKSNPLIPSAITPTNLILESPKPTVRITPISENKFASTIPEGRIKDLSGSSKFGDLGVMSSGLSSETKEDTKLKPKSETGLKEEVKEETKTIFNTKSSQDLISEPKEKQKETLVSKQSLKQKQELKQKQLQSLRLSQEQRLDKQFNVPTVAPVILPDLGSLIREVKKGEMKDEEIYEVFTKKFGKDVSVGKRGTATEAGDLLRTELKTTLRASAFVTKGKEKVRPELLGIPKDEFRKSKVDPFRVVQKKEKRLGTKKETGELQFFKKKKKGKKSLLDL